MRRWSAALVAVIVLCILLLEHLGLEPDGYRTARAQAFVREHPEACLLEGRVTEAEYAGEEKCRITVDLGHEGKILLTVTGEGCPYYDLPGRSLRVRARCSLPEAASNPGAFDYRNHLRSEGICLLGRCSVTDLEPGRLSRDPFRGVFPNRASRFRYRLYHQLEALDPETAGILTGMLFGSKEHLEGDVYESFRENGTAHILCVSGLHVGVIYGGMCALLGRRRRSRTGTLLVAGGLILYAFLASFSVSVTRAVWMIFLSLLAERIHRRYDMLSAAFVTAACLLVRQPALIYNSGFLLSFSAVISLGVAGGGLERFPAPASFTGQALRKLFLPVTAIQAGMVPVNACLFHYFSLAAFLANLPVIFLSAVIIPLSMAAGILSLLPGPFTWMFLLLGRCCGYLAEMMCFFNDLTGLGGRLSWQVPAPSLWMVLGFYLVLGMLLSEHSFLHRPDRKRIRAAGILLLVLLLLTGIQTQLRPDAVFVDVGQGDCIHLRTREGKNYLVDGGGSAFSDYDVGKKVVVPYLLGNGVGRLDGVFISHMDADHYKGLVAVLEQMKVRSVYLYEGYENCLDQTLERLGQGKGKGPEVVLLSGGDRILLGRNGEVRILFPEEVVPLAYEEEPGYEDAGEGVPEGEGETDLNSTSLVMRVELRGLRILLTGDLGEEQEKVLAEEAGPRDLSAQILKIAHHGSRYSSAEEFLEAVSPRAAVIQVGEGNRFGHPAWQTLYRCEQAGAAVFRTDEDGAVLVRTGRDSFTISGYKSGKKMRFERDQ